MTRIRVAGAAAGLVVAFCTGLAGCGAPPISNAAAMTLQQDVQKVREAAAGYHHSAFKKAIAATRRDLERYQTEGQVTPDQARSIRNALDQVAQDPFPTRTPSPTRTSSSPAASSSSPAPAPSSSSPSPSPSPTSASPSPSRTPTSPAPSSPVRSSGIQISLSP